MSEEGPIHLDIFIREKDLKLQFSRDGDDLLWITLPLEKAQEWVKVFQEAVDALERKAHESNEPGARERKPRDD